MSNPKLQLFDDVKKMAAMFPALFKVSEELAQVGSIEQASQEAQNRLELLKVEEAKQRDKGDVVVAEALAQADRIKKDAQAQAAQTAQQADQVLKQARGEADTLIANANAEAARIIDAAVKEKSGLAVEIDQHADKLEALKTMVGDVSEKLAELNSVHVTKQREHDDLVDKHGAFLKSIGATSRD